MIWNATKIPWLAESSDAIIVTPLRIVLIVLVALLVRSIINRCIKRMMTASAKGRGPGILKPFRERVPNLLSDADSVELLGDRRRQRAQTIGTALRSLVSWFIYAIMAMLILAELNVNLGPILASAGVVGLALGFGAQALVKDILSGMFMLMEDQYGVGDVIDVGEAIGTVEVVGLRITTIRDLSGALWYVRNGEIIRVANHSQSWAQVVLNVPLGAKADVDVAAEAIKRAATELTEDPEFSEHILDAPDAQGIVDLGVDATRFRVVLKTTSDQQWAIGRALRGRITQALREAGVSSAIDDHLYFSSLHSQQGDG